MYKIIIFAINIAFSSFFKTLRRALLYYTIVLSEKSIGLTKCSKNCIVLKSTKFGGIEMLSYFGIGLVILVANYFLTQRILPVMRYRFVWKIYYENDGYTGIVDHRLTKGQELLRLFLFPCGSSVALHHYSIGVDQLSILGFDNYNTLYEELSPWNKLGMFFFSPFTLIPGLIIMLICCALLPLFLLCLTIYIVGNWLKPYVESLVEFILRVKPPEISSESIRQEVECAKNKQVLENSRLPNLQISPPQGDWTSNTFDADPQPISAVEPIN